MSYDKNVKVTLNSGSTGNFYTGDIVTGNITLEFEQDHKIESIDLEVVGISKAQWTRAMPTIPYIKIYSEKKKVLSIKTMDIFGSVRNKNMIPAGIHRYPFHFALPHDLPSTFKSSIATVNYCIKVKSKPTYKIKKIVPFHVLGNVNINHLDEMLTPCSFEFHRNFRTVAGKESICLSIRTYKGFASGQTIPFEITVNNEKKIRISRIIVTLMQKLRYTVHSGYATEEKKICKVEFRKIGRTVTELCNFNMEIPQVIPSSIHVLDPMIDISYVFMVEVRFSFHFSLYEDIPVTVASVPVIHYDFS